MGGFHTNNQTLKSSGKIEIEGFFHSLQKRFKVLSFVHLVDSSVLT